MLELMCSACSVVKLSAYSVTRRSTTKVIVYYMFVNLWHHPHHVWVSLMHTLIPPNWSHLPKWMHIVYATNNNKNDSTPYSCSKRTTPTTNSLRIRTSIRRRVVVPTNDWICWHHPWFYITVKSIFRWSVSSSTRSRRDGSLWLSSTCEWEPTTGT